MKSHEFFIDYKLADCFRLVIGTFAEISTVFNMSDYVKLSAFAAQFDGGFWTVEDCVPIEETCFLSGTVKDCCNLTYWIR